MTQEDERKAKGLVLLEYEETRQELELRRVEARKWGADLQSIGNKLAYHTDELFFEGERLPQKLENDPQFVPCDVRRLDSAKLAALLKDIRELGGRLNELEKRRHDLGLG